MQLSGRIGTFLKRRDGNVAMIFALATPMIVGGAAFSVETSYDYYKHQKLAAAADASAYAAALDLAAGSAQSTVQQTATTTATANGWVSSSGTIQVNTPPSTGSHTNTSAVEVILTQNEPRFFTALFNNGPVVLRRRAVAQFSATGDACIVALNASASRAVDVTGSDHMRLLLELRHQRTPVLDTVVHRAH